MFLGALAMLLLIALPAAAQDDYPPGSGAASGPDTVTRGLDAAYAAEGFGPNRGVAVQVAFGEEDDEPVVLNESLTAADDGTAEYAFSVPCSVKADDEGTVTFTGEDAAGEPLTIAAAFVVGADSSACDDDGSSLTWLLWVLALVLFVLAGGFYVARRQGYIG